MKECHAMECDERMPCNGMRWKKKEWYERKQWKKERATRTKEYNEKKNAMKGSVSKNTIKKSQCNGARSK